MTEPDFRKTFFPAENAGNMLENPVFGHFLEISSLVFPDFLHKNTLVVWKFHLAEEASQILLMRESGLTWAFPCKESACKTKKAKYAKLIPHKTPKLQMLGQNPRGKIAKS